MWKPVWFTQLIRLFIGLLNQIKTMATLSYLFQYFFLFFSSLFSLCQLYINALQLFNSIFLSLLGSQFNRCRSSMKFSRSYINIIRIFKTFIFKLAFSGKPKNWKEKRYSFKLSQIFCRRNQQFYILFRGFFMLFF